LRAWGARKFNAPTDLIRRSDGEYERGGNGEKNLRSPAAAYGQNGRCPIGYLIFKLTFLPRILGALMAIAGLCWLTFLSPPLANYLSPYSLASALLAEGLVMLWLLVMGVDAQQWTEQASARRVGPA
jgi:hypothetical protein